MSKISHILATCDKLKYLRQTFLPLLNTCGDERKIMARGGKSNGDPGENMEGLTGRYAPKLPKHGLVLYSNTTATLSTALFFCSLQLFSLKINPNKVIFDKLYSRIRDLPLAANILKRLH